VDEGSNDATQARGLDTDIGDVSPRRHMVGWSTRRRGDDSTVGATIRQRLTPRKHIHSLLT